MALDPGAGGASGPQFLKSGDVIRIEIERVGVIKHKVG
jgi:2-keto-4-pentenoate hydratase/2-oxohepta-3-ene-1,7-dioic acid hydratase in catechol pathway